MEVPIARHSMTKRLARRQFKSNLLLLSPALVLFVAIFFIPILILLTTSFQVNEIEKSIWEKSFTFDNYVRFFTEPYFVKSILRTIWTGIVVVPITIAIGYLVAHIIYRSKSGMKTGLITLVLTPSFSGVLLQSLGLYIIFARYGPVNAILLDLGWLDAPINFLGTFGAVVVSLVHGFLPFMVLAILNSLRSIPANVLEASRSLGADSWTTFVKVTLPLTRGGIMAGSVLVFGGVIGSFSTLVIIGQSKVQLIGLVIYQQALRIFDWSFASVISVALILILASLVLFFALFMKVMGGRKHA
ncbi:ABC transporter permease [Paenibacillus sp.]|uniref:ABC transporter permease n=1 Tax=Paenibacillus sp. TaxID=58172 RepID=UPI002811988E|nr:ABC transporter permease [Paenibacillus sp.]